MASRALLSCIFTYLVHTASSDVLLPAFGGTVDNLITPLDASFELSKGAMHQIGPDIPALHGEREAPPPTYNHVKRYGSGQPYWMSQIPRQGKVAYGNSSYAIWRNVRDYGAQGDGVTDDTIALNKASADGPRCGPGCDSSTVTPAIVYFPPGTYMVSAPIVQQYCSQFIGDANNLPTIMALPSFHDIGLIDADPYIPKETYTNTNNFYRQIRNFVLDITMVPSTRAVHCIHWQVAQATSLQNIIFNLAPGYLGDGSQQAGIYMENGSGGFFEDLIFNGGGTGYIAGSQQFTVRNLTFNDCTTAVYHFWSWVFLYKSITINNCAVGFDLSSGDNVPAVGSIVIQDSTFSNVQFGILTGFAADSTPTSAGTLVLDNVNFLNTDPAVEYKNNTPIISGNQVVNSFLQGSAYSVYETQEELHNLMCYEPKADYARVQGIAPQPVKPPSLLTPSGTVLERSRPQYEGKPVESFVSVMDYGCLGDGLSDDTGCVQGFLDSIGADQIAYFDHGAYLIRDTIQVPNNVKIQGEIWSLFMVDGTSSVFADQRNPTPAFRVGNPGDTGTVEIVDIIFETRGPAPGAIMMEWNLAGTTPGATGMWDTHFRIGGTAGTLLQSDTCTKDPDHEHGANPNCWGAHMLLHLTNTASLIMSNNWGWVSDHELDLTDHNQIDIYNGRGILIESHGPVWVYGGSFEHSQLYNYQIANAKDIYMGVIQSETAYMQANPNALSSFQPNPKYSDPTFSECYPRLCYKTFGLRVFNSTYAFIYGAGLYSFFDDYDQGCLITEDCQTLMVSLEQSEGVYLYALSTKAAEYMVEVDQTPLVLGSDNPSTFCQTVALFEYP